MEGTQFQKYFEKIPQILPHFLGVFSIDRMPVRMKIRTFFICNLSKHSEAGSHWIVIFKTDINKIEVFDSLGVKIDYVTSFFKFKTKISVEFNETSFQSETTASCGYFCIYFSIERIFNLSMTFEHLLEDIFSENKSINEEKVLDFCQSL
jgi:hypothetical protein